MIFVISFQVIRISYVVDGYHTNRIKINVCKRNYKKVRLVEVYISLINENQNIGLNYK